MPRPRSPPLPIYDAPTPVATRRSHRSAYEQLTADSEVRLGAYQSSGPGDRTLPVLRAFLKHLPHDGFVNICQDVLGCTLDSDLALLSGSLIHGVLIPSEFASFTTL